MKQQLKWMMIVVGVMVTLVATVFSAYATAPGLARGSRVAAPAADVPASADGAPLAACTEMEASDVAWVTLNEDGEIEDQVESYDSDTSTITPVFEYDCIPRKVTIVSVFSLDGEVVYSDKESLRSSTSGGLYGYPLGTTDGSPIGDGEWGIEFYNNKTLLTEGLVVVGEGGSGSGGGEEGDLVSVEGKITDKKTKKAVRNAIVIVLMPGVTVEDWVENDQSDEDVYTAGKSDSKGLFTLESQLERETEYSLIVVAKGYKPLAADGFLIEAEEEDPVVLDIKLTK